MKAGTAAVLEKLAFKNNCSETCEVKLPGKILEKIPMKKIIFSEVAGF